MGTDQKNLADGIQQTATLFGNAAFDDNWDGALEHFAEICGGWASQLIGVGADGAIAFNHIIRCDPALHSVFAEMDGGNPAKNLRVRHGISNPVLDAQSEVDFGDLDVTLRNHLHQELFVPLGIPYTLQTAVARGRIGNIGASVLYSEQQGLPDAHARAIFNTLTPAIQQSVRLQQAMEGYGAKVLTGTLESVGIACFVCDAVGKVVSLSPSGEALVKGQAHLKLERGRLQGTHPEDSRLLTEALHKAAVRVPRLRQAVEIGLRSPVDGALLVCTVAPLPLSQFGFGFAASTLVIVRTPRDRANLAPILQVAYGLTFAEAMVAIEVTKGRSLTDIAIERGVSLETVRSQMKCAAAKLGVSRQSEVAAKLGAL